MNKIYKILICLGVAIIQLTLMPIFKINGVFPNLILIGVIVLAINDFEENAFLLAGFGGLVLDMGSSLPFGFNTALFLAATFCIRLLVVKYLPEINFMIVAAVVFVFSCFFGLIFNLISGQLTIVAILINSIYSVVLGLIFFWQLHRVQKINQSIQMGKNSEYI